MIGDDSICQSQSISSNYNSINNDSQTSAQNLIQMCFLANFQHRMWKVIYFFTGSSKMLRLVKPNVELIFRSL